MQRYNSSDADREYLEDRRKWLTFFKERFDPLSHLVMIILFISGHFSLVDMKIGVEVILAFVGTVVFFFKLRCFDEIKDLDLDFKINSTRPLPRGLVSVFEVKDMALLCLLLENLIFYSISIKSGVAMSLASLYSLIMYKEFFLGTKFRDKLTTYATAHTLVTILLSLSIFCALLNDSIFNLDFKYYAFSIVSWLLFNIFELGRKTFLASEEKNQVESYSKVWGKMGAVVLVLIHVCLAEYILIEVVGLKSNFSYFYFGSCLGLFIALSALFLIKNEGAGGKIYRGFSSFYIILIYLGVVIERII